MRWKPGRPDLGAHAARFDVPPAGPHLGVTFLGVSTLLFDDGESALMTDGFLSRPGLLRVALGKLAPDPARVTGALGRLGFGPLDGGRRLDAVVPVHTHFDHALDSAFVAARTGATLVGGESAANVGRGAGLAEDRIVVAGPGEPVSCGAFTLTMVESEHSAPDRFPGSIGRPLVPPARATAYKCGEAWSLLVEHTSGRTALVQGSAGYTPRALGGRRADVAYLGVGQLGHRGEGHIRAYWRETVETVGARRVVLVHWDDFFRPLDEPPRALPFTHDDLDATLHLLTRLAHEQHVQLHLPTVWRREDPWSGLG
ncbi:L-ascorbate metabolism protein UlaG (beta-lactamase superfamily) [Nocardiopsis arvandica]|uniref:L-ascorbate metabolism protein UlaG (Beta-lactamase superfamily) n=1 Tax=Nocardiopsis sinuspersici TaxID=501010 RepID=A0A7Y9XIN6_9ACTN|nr:MBL fold metallo-hydrolase [Nocardiopsis sinuspersici]NYH55407.1 L-ascorbate metabolism protein UlaG (beta-lactamase superfamily) [Nocardiopsis sinuspersici]